MKVELSIKDDKELRDMIKDMIRGAVTTIVRDELKEMSKAILSEQAKTLLDNFTMSEIRNVVNRPDIENAVRKSIATVVDEKIEEAIFQKALSILKRSNNEVEKLVDEKLKNLKVKLI